MPDDPPPPIATSRESLISILSHERNTLHLVVYKSKNQHRASLWFKWLRMLKSSLERIMTYLQNAHTQDDSNNAVEGDSSSSSDDGEQEIEEEESEEHKTAKQLRRHEKLKTLLKQDQIFNLHIHRLQTAIIPNAHTAFTHLITSTQYAGIGMVMLGCLARLHEVLSPFMEPEELDLPSPEAVVASTGLSTNDKPKRLKNSYKHNEGEGEEDTGEVISRESLDILPSLVRKADSSANLMTKRRKVKVKNLTSDDSDSDDNGFITTTQSESRRAVYSPVLDDTSKKRTAIDDLFAGF
ncbi:hypothetical protein H072_4919 [Dactylellina haptotyla CBS 200.50]|uniref:RNase MRP protein 1 RNA binding domain-containing protein n=1 Tax=Dactylellina haptotyla (strain CBS 200.50) TaxID=1284197 RepID=S8AE33_DACHA|nr:hypothetical protein H072_4919 [Dactylellina haptotyla CBS 200.50]